MGDLEGDVEEKSAVPILVLPGFSLIRTYANFITSVAARAASAGAIVSVLKLQLSVLCASAWALG
jgi:hypothetical protein